MGELVIRNGVKLIGTLASGTGDSILTRDASTKDVGEVPGGITSLTDSYVFVGNASNLPIGVPITGDISITNTGVVSIGSGVIVNADINVAAAIDLTKLAATTANKALVSNSSGFIAPSTTSNVQIGYLNTTTSDIQVQLNAKQATITGGATTIVSSNLGANFALIANASGKVAVSPVTSTELSYSSGVTSSIQTQLTGKLSVTLTSPANGDVVIRSGGVFVNLPVGTTGQVLTVSGGGLPSWASGTSNGLPTGGTADQYLRKVDGTDFNTVWDTLALAKITDVTALAADVNVMAGANAAGVTTTNIAYLSGSTSNLQTQLNNKLSNALAQNAIFVGDASNVPSQVSAGSNGQVLQIVAGVPQWQTVTGTGTVTSVAVSGGTTGLSVSGSPITTSGTITLSGTLIAANGGTGQSSYTTGDLLYASSSSALSKLAIGTNGYVLTVSGGLPVWAVGGGGGGGSVTNVSGTTDRITVVDPTTTPVIDIASTYIGQTSITDLGTITTGTWNADVLDLEYGGTSADLSATGGTGQYLKQASSGAAITVGTIPASDIASGAALTRTNDTNVTLTLGGTPATSLLAATSLTLGWSGQLGVARGGTGIASYAVGDIVYATGTTTLANLAIGTASQLLRVNAGATALEYFTPTYISGNQTITLSGDVTGSGTTAITTTIANGAVSNAKLANSSISFAVGTSGTDVTWAASPVSLGGTATINVPDASASARGVVTTGTQTIGGSKTFSVTGTGVGPQYSFAPSITATANSQQMIANDLNNTFANGGFTSTSNVGLRIRSGRVGINTGVASVSAALYVIGEGATSATETFRVSNTSGNMFHILDDSGIRFGSAGSRPSMYPSNGGSATVQAGSSLTINVVAAPASTEGAIFMSNGSTSLANVVALGGSFTQSSGVLAGNTLRMIPTINTTSTYVGAFVGIDYNPTLTSVTGLTHYGVLIKPAACLNGFGVSTPTAGVEIAAGTTTRAPFKLNSGTNLTSPANGSVEFDGTNYFVTSSTTRYTLAKTLTTTATLDFPSTTGGTNSDLTITLTGAALGDIVNLGVPNGSVLSNTCYTAWVSATDTVTVRFNNYDTITAKDPASGTFRVSIDKY